MSTAPLKTCRKVGCACLTKNTGGYCDRHAKEQQKIKNSETYDRASTDPRYLAAREFRSSTAWRRFSEWYRSRHPFCADPFKLHGELGEPMVDVHHIVPLIENIELGLVEENAASLCKWCHNKIESMERRGVPTKHLFAATAKRAKITVVYGPPASGKTTWVRKHITAGDLVIDFDAIMQAISFQSDHMAPDTLRPFAEACRSTLIRMLETTPTQRAFAIHSMLPDESRRSWQTMGAEFICIRTPAEVCKARIAQRKHGATADVVDLWWRTHPQPNPADIMEAQDA